MPSARSSPARVLVTVAAAVACAALLAWPALASERVTLTAEDGVVLAGALFEPARVPAPAVLLLHMQTRTRHDWDNVADRLAARGFVALSFDFRNHGESAAGPTGAGDDLTALQLDVRAALRFLAERPALVSGRVAIVGASIGANAAALAGAADPVVRALVLFSPGLDYRGLRIETAMKTRFADRPALILVSQEDPYSLRSSRALVAESSGLWELRVLEGAGHGTVMFARVPDLVSSLVDWLATRLL
jgi:dienelactone hydrolase